jgi:hypothetical protein
MSNQKVCLDQSQYNSLVNQNNSSSQLLSSLKKKNETLADRINRIHARIHRKPKCDRECQANKLKQTYLNSQQNLLTAPQQEQTAYKNYIVFTEGENAYTQLETQQYSEEADSIAEEIMLNFDDAAKKIAIAIDSYAALILNYKNVVELYEKYLHENKTLRKKIKTEYSDVITNDRKTYYEDQGIDSLNFFYYYVFLTIYIIVVICFGLFAFGFPSPMSYIFKIVILFVLFILPFVSTRILQFIIKMLHAVYNILPKNSYTTL